MIDLVQSRQLAERQLWARTVWRSFQALNIDQRAAAPDVSESLAVFCQQSPRMSDHALALLMARSFCISGDADAAGLILRHDRVYGSHTESWLDVLSSDGPFLDLYPLFSARIVHPQRLRSAGTLWVLDFNFIPLTSADQHELILLQAVRVLTERVATVWEKADGRGTLGVKGLARLASFVRSTALHQYICDVLALCARTKGWSSTPDVLRLDL